MRSVTVMWMTICGALLLAGCPGQEVSYREQTPEPEPAEPYRGNVEYLADASVSTNDGEATAPTAVEDAVRWSQKYSQVAEKLVSAQQDRQKLANKNHELLAKVARLQTELDRAKQELREANQMLIEMRGELNRWKSNVLGFREEMRQAQEAQLARLKEIVTLLGGQVGPTPSATAADTEDTTEGNEGASSSSTSG
jgi:septal ring factor EnvC (AmiA/AmiB activator)